MVKIFQRKEPKAVQRNNRADVARILAEDGEAPQVEEKAAGKRLPVSAQPLSSPVPGIKGEFSDEQQVDACRQVYGELLAICQKHDLAVEVMNWVMGKGAPLVLLSLNNRQLANGKQPFRALSWRIVLYSLPIVLAGYDSMRRAFGNPTLLEAADFDEERFETSQRSWKRIVSLMRDMTELLESEVFSKRRAMESVRVPVVAALRKTLAAFAAVDIDDDPEQLEAFTEFFERELRLAVLQSNSTNLVAAAMPWFRDKCQTAEGRAFLDVLSKDWSLFLQSQSR